MEDGDDFGERVNKQAQEHVAQENIKNPYTELELQFATVESAWGKEYTKELYARVQKAAEEARIEYDEKGVPHTVFDKQPFIDIHSFYTRDFRLGNLNQLTGEDLECITWARLAADLIQEGYIESFMLALNRVISLLEISQSRGGFLRKRLGTLRTENIKSDVSPKKNGLFGKPKEGEGLL